VTSAFGGRIHRGKLPQIGLNSNALGEGQQEVYALNFWSYCHFRVVQLVTVRVILLIGLRDLIIDRFEFCGQVNLAGILLKSLP
jgi:hypothetical protein